ncbi:hypothetical protein SDC9_95596 [bioreactor metagenome]|uniref:Uncharacterized protein n=1 Tax=bioreactor metagenome TaxID=1076179 RepID=A0A645A6S4_9ZZZZ
MSTLYKNLPVSVKAVIDNHLSEIEYIETTMSLYGKWYSIVFKNDVIIDIHEKNLKFDYYSKAYYYEMGVCPPKMTGPSWDYFISRFEDLLIGSDA